MLKYNKNSILFLAGIIIVSGLLLSANGCIACDYNSDCDSGEVCTDGDCLPSDATGVGGLSTGVGGISGNDSQGKVQLPNFLGSGVSTVSDLILKIVNFLMTLALPFAVLMLVWAGFQFATAQGSEEKLRTAKRNLIWTVVGVLVILAAREIVGYITELLGGTGTSSLMTKINNLLTQVYVFLFLLVTVYFFWGIVKFVRASATGGKEMEEGKRHMIWGIVGMAVMAGAWGIVAILQSVLW
ncbi:pilin [Patescibacteria group bacterium]|nr:pilin [Patescibacteria group bacterium]